MAGDEQDDFPARAPPAKSIAFAFSLLADFTALPASLWILMRERTPQAVKAGAVDPQP